MRAVKTILVCFAAIFLAVGAVRPMLAENLKPFAQGQTDNLMAMVFVTTEPVDSFMTRWNTARPETPSFDPSPTVQVGETVNFVIIYAGAGRTPDGQSFLTCTVAISSAGTPPQPVPMDPCVENVPNGPLTDLYMARGFSFVADKAMAGKTIKIVATVGDQSSGATMPLAIEFQVVANPAGGS